MTGQDIKQFRLQLNISRRKLSKDTGIDYKCIWLWEERNAKPSNSSLRKVKKVLGL